MNLLIVEDEPLLRNNLVHQIAWEEYGFEVLSSENGVDALKQIERKLPDVVLLDIQMPDMDGLSLAQWIRERYPRTKVVVLSGHDNFQYAQKALQLGVVKYLLKPAADAEIAEAVLAAARLVHIEWERELNYTNLKRQWEDRLPSLQTHFFLNLLNGRYSAWEIGKKGREVMLDMDELRCGAVAVVQMDPLSEEETRFSGKDEGLLQFTLHSIAKELLADQPCRAMTDSEGNTVLVFMSSSPDKLALLDKMNTVVSKLTSFVKDCLKLTASAGIGTCAEPERIPDSYRQAKRALQDRVIYGHDIVIPFREAGEARTYEAADGSIAQTFEAALLSGEHDQAVDFFIDFAESKIAGCESIVDVQQFLIWTAGLFSKIIQSRNWSVEQVTGENYKYFMELNGLLSKEHILLWMSRVAHSIASYAGSQRMSHHDQIMKQVYAMVDQLMDQDVTLGMIADQIYINSSYLSRLFKQESGKPFSVYVLERKMDKAMELLLGGCKVHEAAVLTGYKEDSYFIRVFRKYWGKTPGEVRSGLI